LLRIAALLVIAVAAALCRAQEPAAAPVTEASAPAATVAAGAATDYPAEAHNFRTFVKRLYAVRALTATLPPAAVEQVRVRPKEWGSDGHGFDKRIASLYGQYAIGVGFEEAAKAIHYEDTRYRRLAKGNFFRRTGYVVATTVTARRQDGSRTFAWSLAANAYGSWGVATLWMPREYRTAGSIVEWGSYGLGAFAVTNLAREYWPDIRRVLHPKKAN
jgi:hypothetical protein